MVNKKIATLISVLLVIVLVVSACTKSQGDIAEQNTPAPTMEEKKEESPSNAEGMTYSEAPMLAQMVSAGTLPPVEQRLPVPSDVMIQSVVDDIGTFGGVMRQPWRGARDRWTMGAPTEEALFRFNSDGSGVEPNVAKGYSVSADNTVYTIYLREGMRWSDGEPFTADDVVFYWNEVLVPGYTGKAVYDAYYSVGPNGERMRAEVRKIDDYTFEVRHAYPRLQFLERVAIDNKWFFAPAHFLKTILPQFVGEAKTDEIAASYGFNDAKSFLERMTYNQWLMKDIPSLRAWVASNDPDSDVFVMKRNPFFWKVDPQGNQLPYIDEFHGVKVSDMNVALLDALAGNYDFSNHPIDVFTTLKENEARGDYNVRLFRNAAWTSTGVQFNQTIADDNLRNLFQDIRFREAASISVDRVQISEIVTDGLAAPGQAAVPPGLIGYIDGWDREWTEYNVDKANQLLDQIGITNRDRDGFRTFADGSKLELDIYIDNANQEKLSELLAFYWEKVGLRTNQKRVDQGTYNQFKYDNQIPVALEGVSPFNVTLRPDNLVPLRVLTPWSIEYGRWFQSKGQEGMEPQGDVAKIYDNWTKVLQAQSPDEINAAGIEIVRLFQKNKWVIGYTEPTASVHRVNNKLANVPQDLVYIDEFRYWGHAHPSQFFYKN